MARNARRGAEGKRSSRRPSVVGSTLGGASERLRARGVPQSGISTGDGLKIAEGAFPDGTIVGSPRERGHRILRLVAIVSGSLAVVLLLIVLVLAILSQTSAFRITTLVTNDTEHVTSDNVAQLITIEPGATLLNVDSESITKDVLNNPWIGSVEVRSEFPDRLVVHTTERTVGALVAMRSGGICWLLGSDNCWIEPLHVDVKEDESAEDAALAQAESLGVVMISDVPTEVSPVGGTACTDSAILAVSAFEEQLPESFRTQVASYSAPDKDGISCILKNGVEVSFGSPSNVSSKVEVAQRILDEFSGQVTYINVRVPARPTYRRVESSYLHEGTGATGVSIDEESKFSTYPKREVEDEEDEYGEGSVEDEPADESSLPTQDSDYGHRVSGGI